MANRFSPGCTCCSTSVFGTVLGCDSNPIADGGTVTAKVASSGITYGPVSTSGGSYTIPISCATSDHATITWTPPGSGLLARFAATPSTTPSGSLNPGTSYHVASFKATAASGYACCPLCSYPLKATLNLSDTYNGVSGATITYSSTAGFWTGTVTVNYPGGTPPYYGTVPGPPPATGCWPVTGVPIVYTFNRLFSMDAPINGPACSSYDGFDCPCSNGAYGFYPFYANVLPSTYTCTTSGTPATFIWNLPASNPNVMSGGTTITIQEP